MLDDVLFVELGSFVYFLVDLEIFLVFFWECGISLIDVVLEIFWVVLLLFFMFGVEFEFVFMDILVDKFIFNFLLFWDDLEVCLWFWCFFGFFLNILEVLFDFDELFEK